MAPASRQPPEPPWRKRAKPAAKQQQQEDPQEESAEAPEEPEEPPWSKRALKCKLYFVAKCKMKLIRAKKAMMEVRKRRGSKSPVRPLTPERRAAKARPPAPPPPPPPAPAPPPQPSRPSRPSKNSRMQTEEADWQAMKRKRRDLVWKGIQEKAQQQGFKPRPSQPENLEHQQLNQHCYGQSRVKERERRGCRNGSGAKVTGKR